MFFRPVTLVTGFFFFLLFVFAFHQRQLISPEKAYVIK
jgi:hypothetical protein